MATLVTFEGTRPAVAANVFLAASATLIGNVVVGDGASIWFGAVLRGDFNHIAIGSGTSVQDNVVVHSAPGLPTTVGDNVIVGHAAMLEGCTVEDSVVLGMGCIVLQGASIGAGAMVAAGSIVTEGQVIPPGHLAVGTPARVAKELSGSSADWVKHAAPAYHALVRRYDGHEITTEGAS